MAPTGALRSVLVVNPVAEAGGSDHALLRLARSLTAAGVAVHAVLPATSPLQDDFRTAGVELHRIPMRRITTSGGLGWWVRYAVEWPVAVSRLARLVRRLDVDLVVTNSLHSWYAWAAAGLTRRPHVWHAREIVVQSALALRVERRLVRTARAVLACSHAVARQLEHAVPPGRLAVVHEDVDRSEFTPARAGRFRSAAGIADDVLLVGFVGRVDTWKGLDVLLAAWATVRRAAPAHLVVVGGPVAGKEGYYRDLQRRAQELTDVTWVGPLPGTADVMADLDLFVAPSTSPEPYGLVLVEALASGAPVVTTDAGGPPEIVARAVPGAGRLVPPGDAAALAEAVAASLHGRPTSTVERLARTALLEPFPVDWVTVYTRARVPATASR